MVVYQFYQKNFLVYRLVQINQVDHLLHQIVYFYIKKVKLVVYLNLMKIQINKQLKHIMQVDVVQKFHVFNYFHVHPMFLNNQFHLLINHQEILKNNKQVHQEDQVQKPIQIKIQIRVVVNHYFDHHHHDMQYRNFRL